MKVVFKPYYEHWSHVTWPQFEIRIPRVGEWVVGKPAHISIRNWKTDQREIRLIERPMLQVNRVVYEPDGTVTVELGHPQGLEHGYH